MGGEIAEQERFGQVLQRPGAGVGKGCADGGGEMMLDELCLSAVAVGCGNRVACGLVGGSRSEVLADQMQTEVDSGGSAGGGEHGVTTDSE
ncbi:hypothetical protein [Streptomyces malaysiensis]|uniref:hypothetical protein n=1 Tax=Streptomyces malaysiensis TaxID=92644 RepID=UPI003717BECC